MNKHRIVLSLIENVKTLIEKTYPTDKKLIGMVTEILHQIAWKVYENEKHTNSPGH